MNRKEYYNQMGRLGKALSVIFTVLPVIMSIAAILITILK